jgi:hypothetical protein
LYYKKPGISIDSSKVIQLVIKDIITHPKEYLNLKKKN